MDNPVAFTRVPLAYFVTWGYGDTDCGGGVNPWETGSFDLALEMARIENFNLSRYTSVIPRQAYEVPIDVARQYFEHGAVLEGILASMNGTTGEIITAGVGRVHVYEKTSGSYLGGFAAEYEGHADTPGAAEVLHTDLEGMLRRRYHPDDYEFRYDQPVIMSHRIAHQYGTVLAGLCWLTYMFPQVDATQKEELRNSGKWQSGEPHR